MFDNLEDVSVIQGYLPSLDCEGHTLITMQHRDHYAIPAEGHEVDLLNDEDAIQLLSKHAEIECLSFTNEGAAEVARIVKELSHFPLAIEVAATYIREGSKNMFTFLSDYHENRKAHNMEPPEGTATGSQFQPPGKWRSTKFSPKVSPPRTY